MEMMSHPLLLLRFRHANATLNSDDAFLMSNRNPLHILRATRLFLSHEILWTSNALARDDNDELVRPNSPRASSWSVEGVIAMMSNASATLPLFFARLLDHIIHTEPFLPFVTGWLDAGSAATFGDFESVFNYEIVMSVLDAAIKELEHDTPTHSGHEDPSNLG